jgi:hypothetical protein
MKNKALASALAGTAVIAGVFGGLTACSGGSSAPPSAASVMSADGYTADSALTSTVQSELGSQGSTDGLSSLAVGSQGSNIQLVMVFDTAAEASGGATAIGSSPGINVSTNGDVLTATGTLTAFSNLGS